MTSQLLMPKATAVWLVDNTALTFDQIAAFCHLHPLEVRAIAVRVGSVLHGHESDLRQHTETESPRPKPRTTVIFMRVGRPRIDPVARKTRVRRLRAQTALTRAVDERQHLGDRDEQVDRNHLPHLDLRC